MTERTEFGFTIKLTKPITEYTTMEILNLESDIETLELDIGALNEIIETENERRNQDRC